MSTFDGKAVLDAIHADAVRRTGFDDFGPKAYLTPLTMLVEEMAAMTETGRLFWQEELTLALIGRLAREANWKAYPTYKARTIERPLVICGVPRTGTTALHKVMSMDPQFQGLEHWITQWPMPRPPRETWPDQPGYKLAVDVLRMRAAGTPTMAMAHEVVADEVDECLEVLKFDLVANRYPSMSWIPTYDAWYQAQDETPSYLRLADTLRLIGLNDDRTWLLKNPGHFREMRPLLTAFPDARVVITHRDPVKSIPSLVDLLMEVKRITIPDPDPHKAVLRDLAYWSEAQRRTERIRAERSADQFFDVDHAEFHKDPIGVVRRLYTHFGLTLTAEVEQKMRDWLAANPAGKLGEHHYSLDDFGLTPEQIRDAFRTR